jgi:arylsulfatase
VLVSQGSGYGGWALWLADSRLHWAHNFASLEESRIVSDRPLGPGPHVVGVRYAHGPGPGGEATRVVDGEPVGTTTVPRFTVTRWSICGDGLTVGYSLALPVVQDYRSPFRCTARIGRVVVDVDGQRTVDVEARVEQSMRAQ